MNGFSHIHPGRGSLLVLALLAAACGGDESMASKSAAAYREAVSKGEPVGGGHEHGGHATGTAGTVANDAPLNTTGHEHGGHAETAARRTTGHDAHQASKADHAAMGHDREAHAVARPRSGTAHGEHQARPSGATHDQHAGMDHGPSRKTPDPHAQHRQASPAPHQQMDHLQHVAKTPSPAAATDPHAQHRTTAAQPQMDHGQHGATAPSPAPAPDPHAQHRATGSTGAAVTANPPRTNAEILTTQPASTLRPDAFDAPAAVSVSEAAKASQPGAHAAHEQRGITPGQDRENPPTPVPATKTRSSPPATDHSAHEAPLKSEAATTYACPFHPEVTSDKPGTCPKCGRALVEKK